MQIGATLDESQPLRRSFRQLFEPGPQRHQCLVRWPLAPHVTALRTGNCKGSASKSPSSGRSRRSCVVSRRRVGRKFPSAGSSVSAGRPCGPWHARRRARPVFAHGPGSVRIPRAPRTCGRSACLHSNWYRSSPGDLISPIPASSSVRARIMRSCNDRPRRSSRHTASTSFARAISMACARPGRAALAPLIRSS